MCNLITIFNWKSLFINEEGEQPKKEEAKSASFPPTNKFPDTETNSNPINTSTNPFFRSSNISDLEIFELI